MIDNFRLSAFGALTLVIALVLAASVSSGTGGAQIDVPIDDDDIGGVVTSSNGTEAGVWVIAETTDLPTKYAKIVATDDGGATCCRTCRKPPTTSGSAGTGWSTHPRCRALQERRLI